MVITDMGSDHYCLRWNNHQNNLLGVFSQLLQEESLVDVTLACSEGPSIRAHKVVLSACSSYFQSLFLDHPGRHPIIILKDVCFYELRTLVEFMYRGEVNVEYCRLPTLLKTAESLQVKGLTEMTHLPPPNNLPPEMPSSGNNQPSVITAKEANPIIVNNPRRDGASNSSSSSNSSSNNNNNDNRKRRISSSGSMDEDDTNAYTSSKPMSNLDDDNRSLSPEDDASSGRSGSYRGHLRSPKYLMSRFPPEQDAPIPLIKQELDRAADESGGRETGTPEDKRRNSSKFVDPIINRGFEFPPGKFMIPIVGTEMIPNHRAPSSSIIGSDDMNALTSMRSGAGLISQSPSASSSLYGGSGIGGLNSAAYLFPPFPMPIVHPPFMPSEAAFSISSIFYQHLYPFTRYPSPSDIVASRITGSAALIKCAICQAGFPNSWLLEQHTLLQHSGNSPRSNSPSGRKPTSHHRRHHHQLQQQQQQDVAEREQKPFQCGQCGQSYRYRSAYLKHQEQDHRARLPADKLFTCDICGMQFRYLKSFKKHRLNHTLEIVQPGTSGSGTVVGGITSTSQRRETVAATTTTTSTASYVGRYQQRQKRSAASGEEDDRSSPITERETVVRKPSVSSDVDEQLTSGGLVSESRVSSSNEIEALRGSSSTADGAGGADGGSSSSGSAVLVKPEREESSSSNARTRPLEGSSTSSSSSLYGMLQCPERQRERQLFACSFCSKTVRSKENLKLHVRKHTGERPFACMFCGRAFGGKSDLTRHVRIHTGERPYHCEMCGKCFARADYLSKHLTTHLHNTTPRVTVAE